MASITLQVDDQLLKKIKYFYQGHEIEHKNPHAIMVAKHNKTTVTIYKSKKVLFQGENAEYEASIFKQMDNSVKVSSKTQQDQPHISTDAYYSHSIGSDEVGTGDYFGPVVVCACYIDDSVMDQLKTLKIDDSKKITDQDILKIAPTLYKILPYSLLNIGNEKYNELMMGDMNLNKLKAMLHKQAITHLLKKLDHRPMIVIDQFCSIKNFNQYTNDNQFLKDVVFTTKAESKYMSVAAASIMARYKFLLEMDHLSQSVGTTLLKGASPKVDAQASDLVMQYGQSILNKISKKHFKNTEKVTLLLKNK